MSSLNVRRTKVTVGEAVVEEEGISHGIKKSNTRSKKLNNITINKNGRIMSILTSLKLSIIKISTEGITKIPQLIIPNMITEEAIKTEMITMVKMIIMTSRSLITQSMMRTMTNTIGVHRSQNARTGVTIKTTAR